MAYLDILILEALIDRPRHGYEIKRNVEGVLGGSVSLNNNVLYPALRRFEEIGAVEKTVEQQESRPPRHVYRLTPIGRQTLESLIRHFPPEMAQEDPEFLTRVAFFERLEPEVRREILDARQKALELRADYLTRLRPAAAEASKWSGRVVDFVIRGARLELRWIDELRRDAAQRSGAGGRGVEAGQRGGGPPLTA